MKQAIKGFVLSGFILPGLGQLVLKRYLRGTVFLLAFLGSAGIVTGYAVSKAFSILEEVMTETGTIDMGQILEIAQHAATKPESILINIVTACIFVLWIGSAVDAYRIGRELDRQARAASLAKIGIPDEQKRT